MNPLIHYQCVDFKKLLILKSHQLKITDQEAYILLIVMTMIDLRMKPINPQTISQFSSLSIKEIDHILITLLDKHYLTRKYGKLNLDPLFSSLLDEEKEVKEEMNLITMFENAFARALTNMELEIIQSFKTNGYDDQMIIDALNEAVKSNVLNFRYIEKILDNWSKYGVKKRYAPQRNTKVDEVDEEIKNLKWW